MAQLQMPSISPGPLRNLIGALYELHGRASWPSMDTIAKGVSAGKSSVHKLFVSGELPSPDLLLQVTDFLARKACARPARHNETVDDWCDRIDALFQEALRDQIYSPTGLASTLTAPESSSGLRAAHTEIGGGTSTLAIATMGAALPDAAASAAVLAGTSNYTNPRLGNLPGTAEQVGRLRGLLTDPSAPVFDPATVTFLDAPTRPQLLDAIAQATATADDTVFFYFAGHGLVSRRGGLLLAAPDTDPDADYTAIAFEEIRDLLAASKAKRVVVVLDSCYAGQAANTMGSLDGLHQVPTSLVLASTGAHDAALQLDGGPIFTSRFNDILESGIPDGPALLDLTTIYQELRVRAANSDLASIPHLSGNPGSRPVALARNHALPDSTNRTAIITLANRTGSIAPLLQSILADVNLRSCLLSARSSEVAVLAVTTTLSTLLMTLVSAWLRAHPGSALTVTVADDAGRSVLLNSEGAQLVQIPTDSVAVTEPWIGSAPVGYEIVVPGSWVAADGGVLAVEAEFSGDRSEVTAEEPSSDGASGVGVPQGRAQEKRISDKRTHLTRSQRERLVAQLKEQYEAGASIRALARETGLSYRSIQDVLRESRVKLRRRDGAAGRVSDEAPNGPA